jgi:23S rRNA maturation mini-RNase III
MRNAGQRFQHLALASQAAYEGSIPFTRSSFLKRLRTRVVGFHDNRRKATSAQIQSAISHPMMTLQDPRGEGKFQCNTFCGKFNMKTDLKNVAN